MSSDETTWLNETEFEIQNQSERVNPETIKRNCSGVRKYRFYKSLGSTELKGSCRSWGTPQKKFFVESARENFSLFRLGGLKLLSLISGVTIFQNPDIYQFRVIRV